MRGAAMKLGCVQDDSILAIPECDFCQEFCGVKSYVCHDYAYEDNRVFGRNPSGMLFACRACSGFIDLNAWAELTDYVFETFLVRNAVRRRDSLPVRVRIGEMHQMFRDHRICEDCGEHAVC